MTILFVFLLLIIIHYLSDCRDILKEVLEKIKVIHYSRPRSNIAQTGRVANVTAKGKDN